MRELLYLVLFIPILLESCDRPKQKEKVKTQRSEEIIGVDISHFQGDIEWQKVNKKQIHFVIIKSTEGGDWRDPNFKLNWKGAREAGFVTGAYHVFTKRNGEKQANFYSSIVPKTKGCIRPCVDLISRKHVLLNWGDTIITELKAFNTVIKKKFGVLPIIYATKDILDHIKFKQHFKNPIWIQQYHPSNPEHSIKQSYVLWQYTISGNKKYHELYKNSRSDKRVDLDRFNGDYNDLKKILLN